MSEFSCNTVRDMLPLYVDNIVSDDTRAIVEEHLTSCDACRKEYENMKMRSCCQRTEMQNS